MPIRLANRSPGTYHLVLKKDGYHTWEKEIIVESKKTTYIRDILLLKKTEPKQILSALKNTENILFSSSGKYALIFTKEKTLHEIHLLNIENNDLKTLFRASLEESPTVEWSPFHDHIAIISKKNKNTEVFLYNTLLGQNSIQTIPTVISSNIQWQDAFIPSIYLESEKSIYEVTQNQNKLAFTLPEKNTPWYITNNKNAWTFDEKNNSFTVKNIDNNEQKEILFDEKINKIIEIQNEKQIIAILDNENIMVGKIEDNKITKTGSIKTKNFVFNAKKDEYYLFTPWEFWTIYGSGEIQLYKRTGNTIKDIAPLDEFGTFAIVEGNTLGSLHIVYNVQHELIQNTQIQKIFSDIQRRSLYFIDENKNIWELKY